MKKITFFLLTLLIFSISGQSSAQCLPPTLLTVADVTTTTATLEWTPSGGELRWIVVYGPSGFNPNTTGSNRGAQINPEITLTGLSFGTTYDFYVKATCGRRNESPLAGPTSFTTECPIATVPYLMDFETATEPDLPICTSVENAGTGFDWETYNDPGLGFTGNVLSSGWSVTEPANTWFYTQGIQLMAGTSYEISYKYGIDDTFGSTEKMKVAYGTSPTATSMTNLLADYPNITHGIATEEVVVFTPTSNDVYYFGFNAYSDPFQFYLYLDDISIVEAALSGYVYENGIWTPANPSGVSTAADDIHVINGTASLAGDTYVNNLNIHAGATLEVNNTLNLSGNIFNNGNLVFVSSAAGSGELGPVPFGSTITGNATVQRYMSNRRSYRMVSSAVNTSTSIHDNWQEGSVSNTDNPAPGFGTHITGSIVDQQNGFDGTPTGNPSLYTADVSSQMFQEIANTDVNTLTAGDAYLLFVRGDRGISLTNNTSSSETVLRTTGSLITGPKSMPFNDAQAGNLIMFGNPYQSTVDAKSVLQNSTNVISQFYYVYDPTLADHGGYVTVNLTHGDGTNTAGSTANKYLQPGQAAQAMVIGDGADIIFDESDKAPGNFTNTYANGNRLTSDNLLTVQLYTTENFNNNGSVHDSFGIIFGDGNNNAITSADAFKPMNFNENLGINNNGTYLSIEQREMPQSGEVFAIHSSGYNHSDYTLKLTIDGLETNFLYLDDHFYGTSTLLEAGDNTYNLSVDANDSMSIATDRFSIRTEERLGVDSNNALTGIRLFPNPMNNNTFYINAPQLSGETVSISVNDMLGREIYNTQNTFTDSTMQIDLAQDVKSGIYMVTLSSQGESVTLRIIKR